jgi:hypothetical protein
MRIMRDGSITLPAGAGCSVPLHKRFSRQKVGQPPETDNRSHPRAQHEADLSRCPGWHQRMRAIRSTVAGRPRVATLPGRSQAMPHVFTRGRAAQERGHSGIVGHLSRYGSSRGARRNPHMHAGQGLCVAESRKLTGSAAPRMPASWLDRVLDGRHSVVDPTGRSMRGAASVVDQDVEACPRARLSEASGRNGCSASSISTVTCLNQSSGRNPRTPRTHPEMVQSLAVARSVYPTSAVFHEKRLLKRAKVGSARQQGPATLAAPL